MSGPAIAEIPWSVRRTQGTIGTVIESNDQFQVHLDLAARVPNDQAQKLRRFAGEGSYNRPAGTDPLVGLNSVSRMRVPSR